jgi:chromosome segregation ATPase
MPETRPDAPRYLRTGSGHTADNAAVVDATDLLARLAERTEELAEARVRQKHAEAGLKRRTQELDAERKAHREVRQRLETDCRELQAECEQVSAECGALEAEVARQQEARTAAEVDLKRAQDRVASLEHQLQIAWAQLQQDGTGAEQRPWWSRSSS